MFVVSRVALLIACSIIALAGCGPKGAAPTVTPQASPQATQTAASPLESKALEVVDGLSRQDFAAVESMFSDVMKSALPEAKLGETWKSIVAKVGSLKSREKSSVATEQGYDVVYVSCAFERATLKAKVVFGKKGEVDGLFFQ